MNEQCNNKMGQGKVLFEEVSLQQQQNLGSGSAFPAGVGRSVPHRGSGQTASVTWKCKHTEWEEPGVLRLQNSGGLPGL